MAKKRRGHGKKKKSLAVMLGAGGTALMILLDKGQNNPAGGGGHPSIIECLTQGMTMQVTLDATKQSVTNIQNYIPVTVGVGAHFVGAKVLHVNASVSKNVMVL